MEAGAPARSGEILAGVSGTLPRWIPVNSFHNRKIGDGPGYAPTELSTEAVVTQETEGAGFRISHSALNLRAKVPNLPRRTFETMAWHAVNNCAISKALRTQVRLDARLV